MVRTFMLAKTAGIPKKPYKMKSTSYTGVKRRRTNIPMQVSNVQNLIGKSSLAEVKCRDQVFAPGTAINTVAVGATVYIEPTVAGLGLATGYTCINCVEQGQGVSQRIGNKIVIKSLRLTGSIIYNTTADATDVGRCRLLVVYDKQTNNNAPAITNIIESVDTGGGGTTTFGSPIKISNRKRFAVLRDQVYEFGALVEKSVHSFDFFIKKQMEVAYYGTATPPTVTNIATGAIYLIIFNSGNFTHVPKIQDVNCRIRYND